MIESDSVEKVANGDNPLSQKATATTNSTISRPEWDTIDAEFESIIGPTAFSLGCDDISPSEAGDMFSTLLRAHLVSSKVIKPPPSDRSSCSTNILRRIERIERAAEHLKSHKQEDDQEKP